MRTSHRGHTRRRVLGMAAAGAGSAAFAGCGVFDHDAAPPPAADPLEPLLAEAVALAAAYDRVVATQPALAGRLTPLADDHRAHAAALAELIGRPTPAAPPPSQPAPSQPAPSQPAPSQSAPSQPAPSQPAPSGAAPVAVTVGGSLAALRAAEQTAHRNAVTADKQAPSGRAALIGSIAACRATHVEALR